MNKIGRYNSYLRIGVFTPWFKGDYQFEFISGIEYEAKRHDIHVLYFAGRVPGSPYPHEEHYNIVYNTALEASLDGLVIMPMLAGCCTNEEFNNFVSQYSPVPLVTINSKTPYGNAIFADNVAGFQTLMRHLIEEHEFHRLAFIGGPDTNPDAVERARIYASMLKSYGMPFNPLLVVEGNFFYQSGKDAVRTFFDDRHLRPGEDIDAIVCANDLMAHGALKELRRRGIKVPSDVALTGFDGIRYSLFPRPAITSVCQHVFEIGRVAVSNLIDYDPDKKDLLFDTELVIGTSCGCSGDKAVERKVPESFGGIPGYQNDLEYFFNEVLTIIENLKFIKATKELDTWLAGNLPFLGIESAYIFIYRDSPSFSPFVKFLVGYHRKGKERDHGEKVLPLHGVFDKILPVKERRSYCILPLLYHKQQYGLLAMEVFTQSANAYDALAAQIGNFIWNSMLMEEVRKTNGMLRRAYEQKTRFFINVAHETKTPLTLIKNYLERSIQRYSSDPDLAVVKKNVDILLENMLHLLDAERLEKGSMSFSHDSFIDLPETTRQKCELFRSVAEKKDITINLNTEKNIFIKIDPWALDRILNNLLDNAIRYTQDGGNVSVDVKKTGKKAVFRVIDNGPGLSADMLSYLFDPYYQLSRKRSGKQGIGVGLSIVKKIIDDLGASITVVNNKNGGACFTCVFSAHAKTAAKKILKNIPLSKAPAGIVFNENIEEEDISGNKSSILIVDDNVQMLNFLKMSLKSKYNVFLAVSVPAALAKIKTTLRPELIISDIMMDGLDGYALLERITETEEFCDIPFIFLTAVSTQDEEIRGLAEGAIDYIKKPFSLPELEKKIESIIALRKRMKKRDVMDIRKGFEGLLSKIIDDKKQQPSAAFESLCVQYGFTPREKEIIKLLLEGLINKEIAQRLHLSKRSIEYHITNIYKKTGVNKRYGLLSLFNLRTDS